MTAKSPKRGRPRTRVEYNVSTPGVTPDDVIEKVSRAHAKAMLASGTFIGDPGQPVVKSARQGTSENDDETGGQRAEEV